MLLEIDNFDEFKIFFDVVYEITDLIELQLYKDKMVCSILDKAHTRFMSVEYGKDFFAVFDVQDMESVTLFAEDLHKIIKSVNKIDTVVLSTNENYLTCKIDSGNGNSRIFEFVLPADYIESPQPPSLDLPINFELELSDLKQGLNDLNILGSDEIQFNLSKDLLSITAGVEVSANYSSNIIIDNDEEMVVSSRFSTDYISQLLKFNKIDKSIKLTMGDDMPLIYTIEDEIMNVSVKGLIAPRVEMD